MTHADACPESPQIDATWLGLRRNIGRLVHPEQETDLLLWLDGTAGQLRAFHLCPHGREPHALAILLETAMHAPIDGCAPAVPRLVAFATDEGTDAVERIAEAHGAESVERDLAPVEAVLEQLKRELTSPALALGDLPSTSLQAFYAASAPLLLAAPWVGAQPTEALRLEGVADAPIYVLLIEAPQPSVVVFFDEMSALSFLLRGRTARSRRLVLGFHDARRMAAAAAAAASFGWKGDVVPMPARLEGDETKLARAAELELLADVSAVLVRLEFRAPFREHVVHLEDGREVRAAWPLLASPFGPREDGAPS